MTLITKDKIKIWIEAALIRALRTAAQTAVAMIPVGIAIQDVSWPAVAGTALLAAVLSILTSVAGIPEVNDGDSLHKVMTSEED